MTQKSWPWSTVAALGDGAAELNEANSREFLSVYFAVQDPAVEGVSKGVLGELAVSGIATPLTVQPGSGVCYGLFISDAAVTLAVSTPAVGTTGGRVVLQTNWAGTGGAGVEARTRLVAKKNSDGNAAPPALVQTVGTTWEISLATFTITTGGVITVTDARTFRKSTMVTGAGELSNNSATNAVLRDSAAVSVIGRAANSSGDPADIAAGANDRLLARVGDALSFVQLTIGMLADNLLTYAKLAQLAGLSILGRSANSTGNVAAITGTEGQALRVSGGVLGFGTLVAAAYAAGSVVTAALADLAVTAAKIADSAISFAKLGPGAALSVWGQASNVSGTIGDIQAGTDGHVLRRLGNTLGFGTVATAGLGDGSVTLAKLAADSVDDTKAGPRVPQFYRRQGGHASEWQTAGNTNYTPAAVRMQAGSKTVAGTGLATITFPVPFSNAPLVFLTPVYGAGGFVPVSGTPLSSQVDIELFDNTGAHIGGTVYWLAVGTE